MVCLARFLSREGATSRQPQHGTCLTKVAGISGGTGRQQLADQIKHLLRDVSRMEPFMRCGCPCMSVTISNSQIDKWAWQACCFTSSQLTSGTHPTSDRRDPGRPPSCRRAAPIRADTDLGSPAYTLRIERLEQRRYHADGSKARTRPTV